MNHAPLERQSASVLTPRQRELRWAAGILTLLGFALFAYGCASGVSYSPPVLGGGYVETTQIVEHAPGNFTATVTKQLTQGQNAKTPSTMESKGLTIPDVWSSGPGTNAIPKELVPSQLVSLGETTPPAITIPPPPDYTKYVLIGAGILITLIGVGLAGASAYPAFILFAPLLRSIGTDFGIFGAALILVGVFTKELAGLVWFLGAGIVVILLYMAYTKLSAHKATLTAAATSKTASNTTTTSVTAAPAAPATISPLSPAADAATALKNVTDGAQALVSKLESILNPPPGVTAPVLPPANTIPPAPLTPAANP